MLAHLGSVSQVKKYWTTILLLGTLTTLILYFVVLSRPTSLPPYSKSDGTDATMDDSLNQWYPVESALIDLFPKEIYDRMNAIERKQKQHQHTRYGNTLMTPLLNRLFKLIPRRRPLPFSWSNYYHQQQDTSSSQHKHPSYRCEDQSLPYPILYHLVKQVLKLNDTTKNHDLTPDLTVPFILLPYNPSDHSLSSGEPICIRAIIPPSVLTKRPITPFHYRYQPYQQTDNEPIWWDMIQLSGRQLTTNASVSLDMQPWDGHHILRKGYQKKWFEHENNVPDWSRKMMQEMEERGWLHIYQVDAVFDDPGTYLLDAKLEFQDAYWNTDLGPVQPYLPLTLHIEPDAKLVISGRGDLEHVVLKHLELPICQGGKGDHQGRWLPWPFGNKVDAATMVTGLDKHGKFWAPFKCRYRPLSHLQFHRCLAQRFTGGLNVYGDSNMRRSIKSFLSHGQWCKNYERYDYTNKTVAATTFDSPQMWTFIGDSNQIRVCQCEDFKETTWNPTWFNATARRWDVEFKNTREETRMLGNDTEWDYDNQQDKDGILLSSYKWDGLTFMNDQGWQIAFTNSAYQLPSTADLIIISLVNWDMAYMQLDDFQQSLISLIQHLKTQYFYSDRHPRLIYRTPQYYCCRVDQTNRQRKSNTARMKTFDLAARQLFQSEFDDKDFMIWDVTILGEARTWDEKVEGSQCGANHAQADVIHVENQVLMNALCNQS